MSFSGPTTAQFSVPTHLAGSRLDKAVLELATEDLSRSQVQRLIAQGLVTLGGNQAKASQKVTQGQAISLTIPPPEPVDIIPEAMDLDILYEDADIIVINKSVGLVVHPAAGHFTGTLVHGLLHHCGQMSSVGGKQRPGIVHRLDKDTSGAMVAAKSDLGHRRLVTAFAAGAVRKSYLALVWGSPRARGTVETPIGRHPKDRKRMSGLSHRGKSARTTWQLVRRFESGVSLLKVRIHTGRTHQIRVHLSEAGHPVLGDTLYAGRMGRKKIPGAPGRALEKANRQMLHALELGFTHPASRQPIDFTAPLPPDYRAVLHALAGQ